jgi:(3R)-3-hydroxyacyl-CoA dehydrogenase / 3a,7a,12a-trihydroxy-5b-cholest-24-enoyl-CoA hydratase / enoyl-CoA hydratase 2
MISHSASRMTKDILPEEFYNELKPSLIAPVVCYLCHENTEDNGNIIESACGWATKVHFIRGKGALLRTSITEGVTPEFVRDRWDAVTDMSQATHLNSIGEASASFMGILEELKSSSSASSKSGFSDTFSYSSRDLILYALGIGISTDDEDNLRYLYENHPDFSAFPTYSVLPGLVLSMSSGLVSSALKNFDLSQVRKIIIFLPTGLSDKITLSMEMFSFRSYTESNILSFYNRFQLIASLQRQAP